MVPFCGLDSQQTTNILKRAHNEDDMKLGVMTVEIVSS